MFSELPETAIQIICLEHFILKGENFHGSTFFLNNGILFLLSSLGMCCIYESHHKALGCYGISSIFSYLDEFFNIFYWCACNIFFFFALCFIINYSQYFTNFVPYIYLLISNSPHHHQNKQTKGIFSSGYCWQFREK